MISLDCLVDMPLMLKQCVSGLGASRLSLVRSPAPLASGCCRKFGLSSYTVSTIMDRCPPKL